MSLALKVTLNTALPSKRHWTCAAQTFARAVLKSTSRCRTRARRRTSALAVESGLASMDWHTPKSPHTNRAMPLFLRVDHRLDTFGMLTTYTSVVGEAAVIVAIAVVNWAVKSATEVICASVGWQTSLPPMRTVTEPT